MGFEPTSLHDKEMLENMQLLLRDIQDRVEGKDRIPPPKLIKQQENNTDIVLINRH